MNTLTKFGLAGAMLASASFASATGIPWQTDLGKAQKLAKRLHKPIFVDFYADW